MRDDIWIEDDEPRCNPRSVVGVVAIAAVPWVIVAGMVLLPDRDPPTPSDQGGAEVADAEVEAGPDGEVAQEADGPDAAPDTLVEDAPGERSEPGSASADAPPAEEAGAEPPRPDATADANRASIDRLLAATATVVARAWATGVDPHLDVPGVPPANGARYAEHVAVESIERSGSEFAVVTLIAVVLEDLEDGLGAELRRLAVPFAVEDGTPRLAGVPWWLAPPRIEAAEVRREVVPSSEVEAEAEAALHAAGYREVEVGAVHRTSGWPWIVEMAGLAPGGEPVTGELWLRLDGDRFVLAGEPDGGGTGGAG